MEKPDLKIALIQMSILREPRHNADEFLEFARTAVARGANVVVGCEMMLAPYLRGDSYEDPEFIRDMNAAVEYIIEQSTAIDAVLIFGGIGLDEDGTRVGEDGRQRKYNAAFVVHHGALIRNEADMPFMAKTLLPDYRIFDDNRHFHSLRKLAEEQKISTDYFLKPFHVHLNGYDYQLGVMLCEDMWDMDYSVKPARALADQGAEVLINLSCSPWTWRKNQKRDQIIRDICRDTGLPFIYVNNIGCQNNGKNFIVFDGSSTAYDAEGNIVAMCQPYQPMWHIVDFGEDMPPLTRPDPSDIAQMYEAIEEATLGFLDTLPEHLHKVVIGVSGGIDSALSAAFFTTLLGAENVIGVNMPYKHYNAAETKDDAKLLCERLGIEYRVEPIDDIVDATARAARVQPGTAAHKTIQATARLQVLVGTAAKENAWFPCNANWDEIFFGYGTLNGDLRGDFAPWMNVLKRDVFRLADYMNREIFKVEIIPQSTIERAPMDELVEAGDTPRDDPFHYGSLTGNGYHDQLVRAFVVFRHGPEWFLEEYQNGTLEEALMLAPGTLNERFDTVEAFVSDVERCFGLYHSNIRKHIQSVPGPLLDKRSFGFDLRESIAVDYKTRRYQELREQLLAVAQIVQQKVA